VRRGKPEPDVYIEAARRLGVRPELCAAVEDSTNGIRSASAAGTRVVAVPRPDFPAAAAALRLADAVLDSLAELTPETLAAVRPEA
jgi:beta-phosphoglucomutase-like phosphatase (HAD superfamily)